MPRRALAILVALALIAALLRVAVGSSDRPATAPGAAADPAAVAATPAPADPRPGAAPAAGEAVRVAGATTAAPPGAQPPGARQRLDLRRRAAEAAGLRRRADGGDAEARREVERRRAAEADPRVRRALDTGAMPDLGRLRSAPPALPEAAAPAEAGTLRAYWLTPGSHDGTYESEIGIAADGRASVETVYESPHGERWRVRYPAWAYRDAQGRLVIDARGQPVEHLQRPPYGAWSPDSMVIGRDGLIELIDDKHDPGSGTSGARGSG